jgi:NADH-quinone oxidoreductase subunit H
MNPWLIALLRALLILLVMLLNGAMAIYMLRKVLGHAHLRLGPTELGPAGLFQLIADIVKLLTKEDRHPHRTDRWLYIIAPFIVFVPSFVSFAFIPFSDKLVAANPDLSVLMMLAFLSIPPLGIFAAGWSSRSKFATIGAVRAIGGMVTYEIPLLLSTIPSVMLAGSMNFQAIVAAQANSVWYALPCLPSFIIFLICAQMETSQAPFDMTEADQELVAGFATEYSGMRFGFMYLAEFAGNFVMASIAVTLFLGGWTLPGLSATALGPFAVLVFIVKCYLLIFLFMMIRGSYSRYRVDRYMDVGWKRLLPFSIGWILVFAAALKVIALLKGGI